MKLHLPRGLRKALLACMALYAAAPAYADEVNETLKYWNEQLKNFRSEHGGEKDDVNFNYLSFDTFTDVVKKGEDGLWSFGPDTRDEDEKKYDDGKSWTFYWVRKVDEDNNAKFSFSPDKPENLDEEKDIFIDVTFQGMFHVSNSAGKGYEWSDDDNKGNYSLKVIAQDDEGPKRGNEEKWEDVKPDPDKGDVQVWGGGPGVKDWSNREGAVNLETENFFNKKTGGDWVIHGKSDNSHEYVEFGSNSNSGKAGDTGVGGAAFFFTTTTENTDGYYGKRYKQGEDGANAWIEKGDLPGVVDWKGDLRPINDGELPVGFVNNGIVSDRSPHGGAFYMGIGTRIEKLKGDFIGNYIETTGKAYGGAMYNMGRIDILDANFIGNYVLGTGGNASNAGAICNGKENSTSYSLPDDDIGGYIGSITGYFIGNYVVHTGEDGRKDLKTDPVGDDKRKDTLGGAIINYGDIGSINGVFIGNYNASNKTANSGVLRNYAQQHKLASIGSADDRDKKLTVIDGIFIGNYSQGGAGDAFAGVMRNNGDINGKIKGIYIGNYAATIGSEVTKDTNPDGATHKVDGKNISYGQVGAYNYLKGTQVKEYNADGNNGNGKYENKEGDDGDYVNRYSVGDSGMAYGGVFYNDIKTNPGQATGKPYIGDIEATFIENYVSSKYGEAFGGVIFNQNADIENITSHFKGNYAVSEYFRARAGALYNDTSAAGKALDYSATIGEIGSEVDPSLIIENYAQGKMAQGGAVYVSNNSAIKKVYALFSGNYTMSMVSKYDTWYYYDIQTNDKGTINEYKEAGEDVNLSIEKFTLTPTAQGGALYVADGGSTQDIYGLFEGNYAQTNGVGSGVVYKDAEGNRYRYVETIEEDESKRLIYEASDGTQITFNENGDQLGEDGTPLEDGDKVKVIEVSMNEGETAQGGAIYVARAGVDEKGDSKLNIEAITANFKNNKVENNGATALNEVTATAQGGAIYVYDSGKVGDIQGNFEGNEAHGGSQGSTTETVQGGAIYVSGGASVANIGGANGAAVEFSGNQAKGEGLGYTTSDAVDEAPTKIGKLETQTVQGGAIYVSSTTVKGENGEDEVNAGTIDEIYADFVGNTVEANADDSNETLTTRIARGGAIYLSHQGKITSIKGADKGFSGNSIIVTGGAENASAVLTAQGGAIYVADGATVGTLETNFTDNTIDITGDTDIHLTTGNSTEKAGGGAIYVDGKANIGSVGIDGTPVEVSGNTIKVGGHGTGLVSQYARGGAIFVGALETVLPDGTLKPSDPGNIDEIYAKISDNQIVADADEDSNLKIRTIRGGAVFLSDGGRIGYLFAGKDGKGMENNSIVVKGGNENNPLLDPEDDAKVILRAGGGAMFVSETGGADGIFAGFRGNYVKTTEATGNNEEYVRGGALFLDKGGQIEAIGNKDGAAVLIEDNHLFVSGNSDALFNQVVQGGAIYASASNNGAQEGEKKTIDSIHADVIGNTIDAEAGTGKNLTTRELQGGAIYLADQGTIGTIMQGDEGFVSNGISLDEKVKAEKEHVYGGAIYVASEGSIDTIVADFTGNYVGNSGNAVISRNDENGKLIADRHAKGGAIYLADGGRIGTIGESGTWYTENKAEGTGEVRAGAIFVSNAEVDDIKGTFLRNTAINTVEVPDKEAYTEKQLITYADGQLLTFGGAMRFDQSTIFRLEANFIQNYTNGSGGGLSLTNEGVIYEVTGDFIANTAKVNGGAVDDIGNIGMRGFAKTTDEKPLEKDFSNALKVDGKLDLVRDSTDTKFWNEIGKKTGELYKNKQGRGEYDGSFTGGFVNSNFLYNTVESDGILNKVYGAGDYYRGAGIYTDKDLFITADDRREVVMSGNKIVNPDGSKTRSAIYVDNMNFKPEPGDYESIVVYLVAKENAILRIDDNIRGHADTDYGLLLRLRGYTDKRDGRDDTGFIILNNRVEQTYTVMDDVTLYLGYKPRTFIDGSYFSNEKFATDARGNEVTLGSVLIGDEGFEDIVLDGRVSTFLNEAGKADILDKDGKESTRSAEHHQSDIFRDSHMSVRSGTVALTENSYARISGRNGEGQHRFDDMNGAEVYTEYLFGNLIAYGADYNYGKYGTLDEEVAQQYGESQMTDAGDPDFPHNMGPDKKYPATALYADFEFGMGLGTDNLYTLAPNGLYYYKDMNGNYTEKSTWTDADEVEHHYELTDVPVKRQMAKSDVLTVFAVWDDDANDIIWEEASKGRVTLNGITVDAGKSGWQYTNQAVNGAQPQPGDKADGFNRDIYVQLINYMLVDSNGKVISYLTKDSEGNEVEDARLKQFKDMFDAPEEENNLNNGYHLLRLSDHFNHVTEATAFMKGSQIMAEEIELATTVTKDDTLHIVDWRDHLAEWAEHEGSLNPQQYADVKADMSQNQQPSQESLGNYDGRKHFLLDQSVYYLNRDINICPNPTEEDHHATGAQMWGRALTIEGTTKWHTLNLQEHNMLTLVIEDQEVRLQSFSITGVQNNHINNYGHLIFDTMEVLDGLDFSAETWGGLVVNNAGTGQGTVNVNQMTITGLTDINFTITTEAPLKDKANTLRDGTPLPYKETTEHGTLYINHTTHVTDAAAGKNDDATQSGDVLKASVVRIEGVVEHQNVVHQGEDQLKLKTTDVKYQAPGEEAQTLDTYSIETGHVGEDLVRETFTTNTYLNTTNDGVTATEQFKAFRDNSLTMEGGAFNLGYMHKHRLVLRDFAVNGGGVFVYESVINLKDEVMGGIDTTSSATYKGDDENAASAKSVSGTGDGLIWLDHFRIESTSDKKIVHVKFVDDGVGNAVKDGMGIADGANSLGRMRIMPDGDFKYNWEVTYNDPEAENVREDKGWVGIRGMYTFRRRGFTAEAQVGPVTDLTGSYVTMMQVYNYAFLHADMYADSMADAQRESLYERSNSVVTPVKGDKNAVPTARMRPCVDKAGLSRGMWLQTYAGTEELPLRHGPKVKMNTYGGIIGGDSSPIEHSNGWDSVWSLYGGYLGSTQRYEGVRIRQNGAAIGGTGTFYKGDFFTALTASVGVAQAHSTGRAGSDSFDLLMGGIASRTGYNFRVDNGRYVIQPNLQLSYSMFNTFSYTNAAGAHIAGKPTGVLQIHPFVKFIMKTDCTWKPYATVGFVYNMLGKTRYTIDGTSLPSLSVDPYAEYSLGVQRTWDDEYTLYIQVTGRSGGRDGVELNTGLRWVW